MRYTIYKTTNLINDKFYIGKHQTLNPDDRYYGSGIALKRSIKKYGKKNFKKEILHDFDTEAEMNEKEIELVSEEFVKRSDTYNLGIGGEGGAHFKDKTHSDKTRALLSDQAKNRVVSDETKAKIAKTLSKQTISQEQREKISKSQKKRYADPERKRKHSEAMKEWHRKRKLMRVQAGVCSSLIS